MAAASLMGLVLVDPETDMVKMYGCYDVHWPDWCDWVWDELPRLERIKHYFG